MKFDKGLAPTVIVEEAESLQFPLAVNTYHIVCVPAPAIEGLKFPAGSVPGPLYTPVPVTPLVTEAVAIEMVPGRLEQTGGNGG